MSHIVDTSLLTKFEGGLQLLPEAKIKQLRKVGINSNDRTCEIK